MKRVTKFIKKIVKSYMKHYWEVYGPMIEAGMSPNM